MPGYPGCTDVSGSIYFHSNRSCRLPPAHQGMKIEVLTWSEVFAAGFATHTPPLDSRFRGNDELGGDSTGSHLFSYQSSMPAAAGTPRYEKPRCGLDNELARRILDSRFRDELGGDSTHLFSYQSPCRLLPAHRGMKSRSCGLANELAGGFCDAPPRPQRGTSPRATFAHSAIDHRFTIRHVLPVESRHRG